MSIPHSTVSQLTDEGIDTVSDLVEFDMSSIQYIADNYRRPGGRVLDPIPRDRIGATMHTPPFRSFYKTLGRPLTAANLKWSTIMRKYEL